MPRMEQVFVVRRSDFFGGAWPNGYSALTKGAGNQLLQQFQARGFFADRATAEDEPAWKQVIPYCVIRRPGQVFCVQRKSTQTEARLHGLLSIGIGGHVNPCQQPEGASAPATGAEFFTGALARELSEELYLRLPIGSAPCLLGILNDDSTAVGKVHFGLVYALDLPSPRSPGASQRDLRVREISKMVGGFRCLVELLPLWQDPARFESWSRILLEAGVAGPMAASRMGGFRQRAASGREESQHG